LLRTEETNASGAVVARYAQTQNTDEPLAMLRYSTTSYFHADGLGSVTSLSSGAGTLVQTYGYDSFGKQLSSTGSLTNPFQFAARESDSETGLYYYRARYYDPAGGRFLSEDPIRFDGGTNFYSYTGNSPVNWYDPFGLDWIRYTGQVLTLYGGKFGDTSNPLEGCAATSGDLGFQSPNSPWQNPVRSNGAADNGDSNDFGAPAVVGLKTKCFSNLEPREAIE
jgi:RHS repeat-associated protein